MQSEEEKRVIPFSPPDVGELEIAYITETLRSGWITTGPRVRALEQRLAHYIKTGRNVFSAESEGEETILEGSAVGSAERERSVQLLESAHLAAESYDHKVACLGSATAALELNLRILGVGCGDEVVVPAYTYTATAAAVLHCGAVPVPVDIQKDGDKSTHAPEMDYDALERAITQRTKAVIAVDFGGMVCDYDRIFEIVERKKSLFTPKEPDGTMLGDLASKIQKGIGSAAVLADSAHSLGSSRLVACTGSGKLNAPAWRFCGEIAHFTAFSFHAVKNLTTAEGGASSWCLPDSVYDLGVTDEEIHGMYRLLSLHGQSRDALSKTDPGTWEYDVIGPWYKCNMTDIGAAMGLAQLDRYGEILDRRRKLVSLYDTFFGERLQGITHLVHETARMRSNAHLYTIRAPKLDEAARNGIIRTLADLGIATNVHFKPLPMFTAYRALGWDIADFPNSYDYYRCLITLPLYSRLTDEDAAYVCRNLEKVLGNLP